MDLEQTLFVIMLVCVAATSLFAAGHALLDKRDARSALGWMAVCLFVPLLGPFLYWCLGVNRISRRARRWHRKRRIVSGAELHPYDEKEVQSAELPKEFSYLRELVVLGDRIVKTHLEPGNRIMPIDDGAVAFAEMLAAIRRARSSINLSSYIFDGDGIGGEIAAELKTATERGVEVRVIVDALGEKYSRNKARRALEDTAVLFKLFLPLKYGSFINLRNHRKMLIVDGFEAFTGGMNIRSSQLGEKPDQPCNFHDMHFHVLGPVVSDLQRVFIEDWFFVAGERLDGPAFFPHLEAAGEAIARCIGDGPDREYRKLELIVMGALSCARKSVLIMTPYFLPDRSMIAALITAALRGVEVVIVLPACNNLPYVHWATRALLDELIDNGIRVYYQPPPFVHTKLMLMDDAWSLIGSANLDTRSLRLNFELNLTVFDFCLAAEIRRCFDRALLNAHPITLQELQQRPLAIKLLDNFAHLFLPYL